MKTSPWLAVCLVLLGWNGVTAPAPAPTVDRVPASLREVIVVFKTHFDLGYTDMASNVVQRYRTTMMDDALKVVDDSRDLPPEQRFAWTLAGWPLARILQDGPGQSPGRRGRIEAAFREGRFVVHALPFTTHTESLEPEDLVRGLGFATRLSREAGLPLPRDAKMTDVPSHSWILPTLLRHAGVDFLHLGCNAASRSPLVPPLFLWEGPDGSRLLTMYTAESYGTGLVPPADWPHPTWLALIHTGDNHGPPRPDEVQSLLAEAKTRLPGVRVRIGRMSDFADGILQSRVPVPVVRGDMPDTWIHGLLGDPRGAGLARQVRPRIAMAEALGTLLPAWGVDVPDPSRDAVDQAYERSLLYGEHTWGGAYWWIYGKYLAHYGDAWRAERKAGRFDRIESSWAEHTAYIETADHLVTPLVERQMRHLARAVEVAGRRCVVFNPLPWKRDALVVFRPASDLPDALRPVDGGEPVPTSRRSDGTWSFPARDVPPMGYRTFVPVEAKPGAPKVRFDAATGVIESPFFRARVDTNRMVLESLVDKASGREWVRPGAVPAFGQFLHERFSAREVGAFVRDYVKITADWATNELGKPMLPPAEVVPYRSASPRGFRASFRVAHDQVTVTGETRDAPGLSAPFVASFALLADQPCVDVEFAVEKTADPWPEAGWIAFPFALDSPRFRLGRLGSIIDPATDVIPGSNRHLFALNSGLTVTRPDGFGAGLCPLDSPLVSLGAPGCWRYSVDDVPREATVFVNLFNNQWTTNFRLWNEGRWRTRVRLWAVGPGDASETALVAPAAEIRFPMVAVDVEGPPGARPPSAPGVGLPRSGTLVTALGPDPAGPGIRLRLWELAGRTGPVRVSLPAPWQSGTASNVDLRGTPSGRSWAFSGATVEVPVRAYSPTTLILNPTDPAAR